APAFGGRSQPGNDVRDVDPVEAAVDEGGQAPAPQRPHDLSHAGRPFVDGADHGGGVDHDRIQAAVDDPTYLRLAPGLGSVVRRQRLAYRPRAVLVDRLADALLDVVRVDGAAVHEPARSGGERGLGHHPGTVHVDRLDQTTEWSDHGDYPCEVVHHLGPVERVARRRGVPHVRPYPRRARFTGRHRIPKIDNPDLLSGA